MDEETQAMASLGLSVACALDTSVNTLTAPLIFPSKPNFGFRV